jgi:hypothetical protein
VVQQEPLSSPSSCFSGTTLRAPERTDEARMHASSVTRSRSIRVAVCHLTPMAVFSRLPQLASFLVAGRADVRASPAVGRCRHGFRASRCRNSVHAVELWSCGINAPRQCASSSSAAVPSKKTAPAAGRCRLLRLQKNTRSGSPRGGCTHIGQ